MKRLAVLIVLTGLVAMPAMASDADGRPTSGGAPAGHVQRGWDVPGSLTTTFAGGNSFAGNTFDLVPVVDLLWTGTDFNITGTTETMEIYTRPGTAQGFENSAAGWTSIGTESVVALGAGVPTPTTIGNGIVLTAASTTGCYIDMVTYVAGDAVNYTNGGPTTFSNAQLALTTYVGKGNPAFTGATFTPRQWNGTIHYDDAVPVELMQFSIE